MKFEDMSWNELVKVAREMNEQIEAIGGGGVKGKLMPGAAPVSAEPVYQFRKEGCANWHDGHPDNSDGGGPYEVRTLYTAPVAPVSAEPVAWLDSFRRGAALVLHYHGKKLPVARLSRLSPGAIRVKVDGLLPLVLSDDGRCNADVPIWLEHAPVAAPVSAEQAALAPSSGQAETRMNTGHAQQNVDHVGQASGPEVAAPVSAEPYEAMPYGADDDRAVFPASVVRKLFNLKEKYRTTLAAQQAPQGWKLVPETIPLAGLDAAIAWMRPAMNEAGRDLAYCLRGVWEILLKSVKTPVAAQAQPLPDSLIPAAPDLEYLRDSAENTALPAFLRGQIAAAVRELADQAQQDEGCACTFAQKMQGDGCRYCNPQEYIDRLHDQLEEAQALESETSALRAARIAYASEFPPDVEGDPDVGNIHANIRKLKAKAQQDADKVGAEPDMFWDDDDPERCQDSIHNVLVEVQCNRGLSVGNVVEVQRAIRLPNVSVRITAVEDEDGSGDLEYEIIDAARKE